MYPFLLNYKLPEGKEDEVWEFTYKCVDELSEDPLSGTVRKGTLVGQESVSPDPGCHPAAAVAARKPTEPAFKLNCPRTNWPVGSLHSPTTWQLGKASWGAVNGKVYCVLWPLHQIHCLHSNPSPHQYVFHLLRLPRPLPLKDITQPILVLENWWGQGGTPCGLDSNSS